ncbi:MAG TPA: glucoamylase family protein [Rhizomicrobium sp.]|nr:glucoamylase family protein [Rhizomicrobium sp.]
MHIQFDRHLDLPIRSELFSAERLEQHAKSLAEAQPIGAPAHRRQSLRHRLFQNSRRLITDYRALARAANSRKPVTSAGEWFLDNFHIVEEQIRQVQKDLPADYYRELPKLVEGPLAGYPRVFGIAWALIAHTDGAFDVERLERFVHFYQQVEPLKIGELWAIAITLRITLVENLRRLMEIVLARLADAERAEEIAKRILDASGDDAARLSLEAILGNDAISPTLIAHLEQRLRNQNANADRILTEIETELNRLGTNSDTIIHEEYQLQGADDISVRNVITAMRLVSVIDWAEFFENVSLVDMILRQEPAFGAMDFPSRDRYRRAIEKLARRSPQDEIAVASAAMEEARKAPAAMPRQRDPGYYLIGAGARKFEQKIGYTPTFSRKFWRGAAATGLTGYIALVAIAMALIVGAIVAFLTGYRVADSSLSVLAFLALLPASDLAISLVNRLATNRWTPKCLPGLALKEGVPDELRTVLVVPALLTKEADIAELISRLEVHYLSNADARLRFFLLSDWTDSAAETATADQQLLDHARTGIRELNDRYAKHGPPMFFLLHRKRQWNGPQGRWMGWERKRGKLHELNRLLRGADDTSFMDLDGELDQLPRDVRYVITLDADTRLPRGAAKRLIGKMAHPLNLPYFDETGHRVVHGHGILQPRVTPSLPVGTGGSLFQWAFSGPNGLDPYAFAVSDVYQDLFEEGSYVGKGIYDIDAFERALKQKIPENTVLSHDLLEGVFARAALASDVELVEEFPSRYDVELARQHRWIRGDWQLLPWIFRGIFRRNGRAADGTTTRGISALGRWKMFDNLRRSLSAPALLLALLYGWQLPPRPALAWTLFLVATMVLPPLLPILAAVIPRRRGISWRGHVRNLARDSLLAVTQLLFHLAFMARIAYLTLDAILRTAFRLFISRCNLLEWVTFAQTAYSRRGTWKGTAFQLAASLAFSTVIVIFIGATQRINLLFAAPFLVLWALSPLIARWASQAPTIEAHLDIPENDRQALRIAARRTWTFFEKFVTAEDNFLPPDNFQETPKGEIAHRTSPTNIGLYLNVVLAARDFGWIGTVEAVERLEATLASLQKLERYRGHFLNWYDTRTLQSMDPRYVSTVDSGNLAGNLLVVKHAVAEMTAAPGAALALTGIGDTLNLLREEVGTRPSRYDAALLDGLGRLSDLLTARNPATSPDAALLEHLEQLSETLANHVATPAIRAGFDALARCIQSHRRDLQPPDSAALDQRLAQIARLCGELAGQMEFGFLYDEIRQLLTIGYRVEDQTLDPNAYDLLASEARLASFLAIAKGDVPTRHWFHLGRTLTPLGRASALQSWSGSMFEYLMPSLIMHEPTGSLIALSNRTAVRRQIDYASRLGIPWGISESQYYALDRDQNYQYSGFGVPDLGIKRGLGENTVIAPYATGLAAMVAPIPARRNLDRLTRLGARGHYGWYEAVDYTRARLPEGAAEVVIQTYMAHHQAMMILGIANVIHDGAMRERFHAEPMVKAAELLLQERMPRDVAVARLPPESKTGAITFYDQAPHQPRSFSTPHTVMPRTHLLSNGNYSLMVTAAGGGYSRWHGLAITRWREDVTRDNWGAFIYLRDLSSGKSWSAGYQPTGREADAYEAIFAEDRATIRRTDGAISTVMEILVSPEADVEARKICITNNGTRPREIEITSYAELALARPQDDDAHPAFSKLFVETEYLQDTRALLATRRPRSPSEPPVWAAHLSVVDGDSSGDVQYETDRGKFLTRNRNARSAAAISEGWPLSNSAGPVLDPVFSLRRILRIGRGQTVTVTFWTMAAASREDILDLVDRHHDANAFDRAATLAATSAQNHLQYLGISGDEAHLFQLLANYLVYHDAGLRAPPEVLERGGRPASILWGTGISGDLPIALVRLSQESELEFVAQIMRAHDYWRQKRLPVDLVILNERASSYAQDLQKTLEAAIHTIPPAAEGPEGKVFLLRADLIGPEARDALRAAARIDLSARRGSLAEQLDALAVPGRPAPRSRTAKPSEDRGPAAAVPDLQFFNGFGGFSPDGREYVIQLQGDLRTPAPWINVIANRDFGFQVAAEGSGFCWAGNSQQNQITAWSNDPVSNEPGEVLYIKDLDSGEVWCPTAEPVADANARYVIRHGQGYTRFEYSGRGLTATLVQFVPLDDPVKIGRLTISNSSAQTRRLQITSYVEWALGPSRAPGAPYLVTEWDASSGAMFARNPHSAEWGSRIAFLDMGGRQTSWTGDRREFLGRNGAPGRPAALMSDEPLSGRLGGGLDACGVQQTEITLEKGKDVEILLLLGQARDRDAARALVVKYRKISLDQVFADVAAFWDRTLDTVQIKTPDTSMNLLVNRWLLYQTLSCRMWGRAGFYQVSGAYGFRDQLQDSMALCAAQPGLVREHLLRAAGRQFPEGDVQHWWLPESGKGIRTRISDDKSWLGYVAAHYIETTGDTGVLDEAVPFLQGPVLLDGQHDAFFLPETAGENASLYEHCARALDASLDVGSHGLPLMGTGDWNDGMNRVGELGKGESVWLGWFLHETLARFIPYAEQRRDAARVARWLLHMTALAQALEETGWDGAWYRRAYFDDGFALGSASNRECRIDAIAQSWAVISKVASPDRAQRAMEAVDKYLVRTEDRLMTLFTPPFVASSHDPGYIKGYPAGIRENGGQYTHGVLWGILAFAMLGNGDRAGELFAMLNPINHARTRTAAQRYRVEPYVACGDVYSVAPNVGRGGWTWYSGSAAWMHRVAIEYILGLKQRGETLLIDPVIPRQWPQFEATFRHRTATYEILVENPAHCSRGIAAVTVDGVGQDTAAIALADDGKTHRVHIVLGTPIT